MNGSVVSVLYWCTLHSRHEWRIYTRCRWRNTHGKQKVFAPTVFTHRGRPTDGVHARPPTDG